MNQITNSSGTSPLDVSLCYSLDLDTSLDSGKTNKA